MHHSAQGEESDRALVTDSPQRAKREINIEWDTLEVTKNTEEVDRKSVKQVDTSNLSLEDEEFHLGVLEEGDNQKTLEDPLEKELSEMQINVKAFSEAVTERKVNNFKALRGYMSQCTRYYGKHMDIMMEVEGRVMKRLDISRGYTKEIYNYFTFLSQVEMANKMALSLVFVPNETEKKTLYGRIVEVLRSIMGLRQDFEKATQTSSNWAAPEFLAHLNHLVMMYDNSMSHYSSEILNKKLVVDEKFNTMNNHYKHIQNLMVSATRNPDSDVLFQELVFFQKAEELKEAMINWGLVTNTLWSISERAEFNIVQAFKQQIDAIFKNTEGLFEDSSSVQGAQLVWLSVDPLDTLRHDYQLQNILDRENREFMENAVQVQPINSLEFQRFARLDHGIQALGNPNLIKSTLILKKFSCRIPSQNDNRGVYIYSSVDGFIVFTLQETDLPFDLMNIRNSSCQRLTHLKVEVREKKPGFFMASWRRQEVEFSSSDEAEEFLVFLAQNEEERESVIT